MNILDCIIETDINEIALNNLFDAHRHGLFKINNKFSLAGIKVDQWIHNKEFIEYENELSKLTEKETVSYLEEWTTHSIAEGISTIIDISGKKYNNAINNFYKSKGINHLLAQYWSKWDKSQKDTQVLILPDESLLGEEIIEKVKEYYSETKGIVMLHALESYERKKYFGIKIS